MRRWMFMAALSVILLGVPLWGQRGGHSGMAMGGARGGYLAHVGAPQGAYGGGGFHAPHRPGFPGYPSHHPTILAITRISDVVILGGATVAITDTRRAWDGMAARASSGRTRLTRIQPSRIPSMPTLRPTTRARPLPTSSGRRLTA